MAEAADSQHGAAAKTLPALAYGPGFATTGTPVSVELDGEGFTFQAPDGRQMGAAWSLAGVRRHGFDTRRCEITWRFEGAQLALSVSDGAHVENLIAATAAPHRGQAPPPPSGRSRSRTRSRARDAATRRWVTLLLGLMALPVVVVGLAVWQFDALVNWGVSRISIAHERSLGASIMGRYAAKWKPVSGPAADLVTDLGRRLTKKSRYSYEFRVISEPTVNAYALPGGYVVVHSGLLRAVDGADELAGVLAHEISHVELRHGLRSLVRSAGLTTAFQLLLGGSSPLATLAGEATDLKFSRATETEADQNAMDRLEAARINPAGLVDFMKKSESHAARMPDWLSTHPAAADRVAALEMALAKMPPWVREFPPLEYDYAAIKAALPEPAEQQ
ncbi:MAG: M48 family metallopeptidase [Rhodocyclaceae bacterium]|nr:M48 family metallopeptidase [Rhodocyclaceae bacterium]MBX3667849.1 M48 family metallopeptidase [Rhodocyclaceae bacterium]